MFRQEHQQLIMGKGEALGVRRSATESRMDIPRATGRFPSRPVGFIGALTQNKLKPSSHPPQWEA